MDNLKKNKSSFLEKAQQHYTKDRLTKPWTSLQSPFRILIIIALSIFICELLVMFVISFLTSFSTLTHAFLDSIFLLLLISPVLYIFIFRPLMLHIRERMQAEEEIREKEKHLNDLLSNVDAIILEGDPYNIYYIGGQVEKILGYPIELWFADSEGPSGFWSKHLHPDDIDKVEACSRSIARGENHSFEYRMIASDDREVWFYDIVTVEIENEKPIKARSIMIDITARKQAEEALLENEKKYRKIFEHTGFSINFSDVETGKFVDFNREAYESLGYTYKEYKDMTPADFDIDFKHDPRKGRRRKGDIRRDCEG